ncbi:hypothetical protein Plhal703r1_c27g0110021 [Plasmopara halstedii]
MKIINDCKTTTNSAIVIHFYLSCTIVERRLCLTLTNFKRVNLGDVVRLSFAKGLCLDTKALHHA